MDRYLVVDDAEWELLVDLLETERSVLPADMYQTDKPEMRDMMQKRLKRVEALPGDWLCDRQDSTRWL